MLTDKEKTFVNLYLESGNATESALNAGFGSNKKSAAVMGHRLLKSHKIHDAINQEFSKSGILDKMLVRNILEGLKAIKKTYRKIKTPDGKVKIIELEAPDFSTRLKYLEMAFKLKGYLN